MVLAVDGEDGHVDPRDAPATSVYLEVLQSRTTIATVPTATITKLQTKNYPISQRSQDGLDINALFHCSRLFISFTYPNSLVLPNHIDAFVVTIYK